MAKAIHEKELILQEKLWSVEEKIRQKIQRDTAAGDDQRHEGQRINRGHAQIKTRLEEQEELRQDGDRDAGLQLLPCRVCNRKFSSERLQKHVQICKKVKQSHRTVFNSYVHRTKGSAIEEFWKTHSRPKSPEVLKKKNQRQNREANAKNLREGRLQVSRP
ncbi:zinc finger C2HC domain-containing protein 1B-like [Plectropomus leopardus]|uniref:zinc finger C2HC domain-containing protein 1B-like n=1 Tax=Plectropomus leopardus TaxID=160734 RepID=UPI001C4CD598|nr:zinc finger C2HC domain-containing protein 1B-like [Plectropomus leopardus]